MRERIAVFILFLFLGTCFLAAHAPKKNELAFDKQNMTLKVKSIHPVGNPENHYVKLIAVTLNGKEISRKEFTRQENKEYQEAVFTFEQTVSFHAGDQIAVTSHCSIIGKTKTVTKVE